MSIQPILLLGNPTLRQRCSPVQSVNSPETKETIDHLRDTLADFRERKGFGRGIAAPQIGISQQLIYVKTDEVAGAFINPKIVSRSRKKFRMWDDCFSFPDILACVERHYSIAVAYTDEQGKKKKLNAQGSLSELLQHEIDHLHGVLAIDRAIDSHHIILRSEYETLSHKSPLSL
ncbi:MAG: peptide deformylase [bacterium]